MKAKSDKSVLAAQKHAKNVHKGGSYVLKNNQPAAKPTPKTEK